MNHCVRCGHLPLQNESDVARLQGIIDDLMKGNLRHEEICEFLRSAIHYCRLVTSGQRDQVLDEAPVMLMLVSFVKSSGDFQVQILALSLLLSIAPVLTFGDWFAWKWFDGEIRTLFIDLLKDAGNMQKYRSFINVLNEEMGDQRRVYSLFCTSVEYNNDILLDSSSDDHLWLDMNLDSKRVTVPSASEETGYISIDYEDVIDHRVTQTYLGNHKLNLLEISSCKSQQLSAVFGKKTALNPKFFDGIFKRCASEDTKDFDENSNHIGNPGKSIKVPKGNGTYRKPNTENWRREMGEEDSLRKKAARSPEFFDELFKHCASEDTKDFDENSNHIGNSGQSIKVPKGNSTDRKPNTENWRREMGEEDSLRKKAARSPEFFDELFKRYASENTNDFDENSNHIGNSGQSIKVPKGSSTDRKPNTKNWRREMGEEESLEDSPPSKRRNYFSRSKKSAMGPPERPPLRRSSRLNHSTESSSDCGMTP